MNSLKNLAKELKSGKVMSDMVLYSLTEYEDKATQIAKSLEIGLQVVANVSEIDADSGMFLMYDAEGLSLIKDGLTIRGDFSQMKKRLNNANLQHEMLVKVAKLKNPSEHPIAIDATAGLGEDSILLAGAGYEVKMFERDKYIAALLEDAIDRAREDEFLNPIVSRMTLVKGDSIEAMEAKAFSPDIVYLDPMFPTRNKSGLIKKKFQLLQQLESPCEEGERLILAAKSLNPKKIIIKRPLKGEYLAGIKPNHSIEGRAIRYDCLV